MSEFSVPVRTTLRIPGNWSRPGELMDQLPRGYRLTPAALILPDERTIEFNPLPPDEQFAEIFQSSCRHPATAEELEIVRNYTVNIGLGGPGGSFEAARIMMEAGAAVIKAGGAGVFIDNCALSHGGEDWIRMTEDGGPDALSFAFVGIVRGREDLWTMGMQVAGLPDIIMRRSELDEDDRAIIEITRYVFGSDKPIGDGHLLIDELGPRFKARTTCGDKFDPTSPMHNPFGRLRLVSLRDIAKHN